MSLLQVLILSIVEGFTEFLPISSTGHLILSSKLLGITPTELTKSFEIAIQLGAIFSVIALFTRSHLVNPKILPKILVSFVPTAAIGFLLYPIVKGVFLESEIITLLALFVGGVVIILFEKTHKEGKTSHSEISDLAYSKVFLIGLVQSVSIIPGVSRAAATIFGGLFLGLSRKSAVEYSFLLAVPTMFAATALDLYKSASSFGQTEITSLVVGFVASFAVAVLSIKFLLGFVKRNNFIGFGIYRILLSIIYFLLFFA